MNTSPEFAFFARLVESLKPWPDNSCCITDHSGKEFDSRGYSGSLRFGIRADFSVWEEKAMTKATTGRRLLASVNPHDFPPAKSVPARASAAA